MFCKPHVNNANCSTNWSIQIFFYAGDRDEPPHIHVERDTNKAKFWLDPVMLQNSGGFSRNEINRIQKLVENKKEKLLRKWDEYFND